MEDAQRHEHADVASAWRRVAPLYLQPLAIEIGGAPKLILGGAVPSRMVVRDALAIDTYFTAALVFLVLIGLLGFPFVKLTSLDRHERFRLRDVALLYSQHRCPRLVHLRGARDRRLQPVARRRQRGLERPRQGARQFVHHRGVGHPGRTEELRRDAREDGGARLLEVARSSPLARESGGYRAAETGA